MLIDQGGRFQTVRTDEELIELALKDLASLSHEEREVLDLMIADLASDGRSPLVEYASSSLYRAPPPSMETWIDDSYYCGSFTKDLFPEVRNDLIELFNGKYDECLYGGSIGAGKTTFAKLCVLRQVTEAGHLNDPHEAYGVAQGDKIAFPCISVTESQAHELVFEKIKACIEQSPFFQNDFRPLKMNEESGIVFPNGIWIPPGLSTERRTLGINAFGAVIEEANFFKSNKNTNPNNNSPDMAEAVYKSIKRRMQSRFLVKGRLPGILVMISSKTSVNSFTERRIKEAAGNPNIMIRERAVYEVAPDRYSGEKFRVAIGNESMDARILIDGEEDPEGHKVIEVPIEFRESFESDINSAVREIAGYATASLTPYISNRSKINECIDLHREHPFDRYIWKHDHQGAFLWEKICKQTKDGAWAPIHHSGSPRFVSIDFSKSGDATGFAMGCVGPYIQVNRIGGDGSEMVPSFHIDFILRIEAASRGEVVQSEIRNLIYQLSAHGFFIKCVSADSFQSLASLQTLRQKGYQTRELSVDRGTGPYDSVKQALFEKRISYYRYEPFLRELRDLQKNWKTGKVDHPDQADVPGASKDCSDAVAQVCVQVADFAKSGVMDRPIDTNPILEPEEDNQWILQDTIALPDSRPQTNIPQESWREEAEKRLADAQPSQYDSDWRSKFTMPFDVG